MVGVRVGEMVGGRKGEGVGGWCEDAASKE